MWGPAKKLGPDWFSRIDVYWIQTDQQTDRQANYIYRYKYTRICRDKQIYKDSRMSTDKQKHRYSDIKICRNTEIYRYIAIYT